MQDIQFAIDASNGVEGKINELVIRINNLEEFRRRVNDFTSKMEEVEGLAEQVQSAFERVEDDLI